MNLHNYSELVSNITLPKDRILLAVEDLSINIFYQDIEIKNTIEYDLVPFYGINNEQDINLAASVTIYCLTKYNKKMFDGIFENAAVIPQFRDHSGTLGRDGKLVENDDVRLINCLSTNTIVYFCKEKCIIFLFQEDSKLLCIDVRRVVGYQLSLRYLEDRGFVTLHANAVSFNGDAVLLCGRKKSGKSTIQLRLLATQKCSFMGNDRSFLKLDHGKIVVQGWVGRCNLGIGTLLNFPQLKKFVPERYLSTTISTLELWETEEKKLVHPREIAKISGKEIDIKGKLRAIVFPQIDIKFSKRDEVIRMNTAEIKEELRSNILSTPFDSQSFNWLKYIEIDEYKTNQNIEMIIEYITNYIPCYRYFTKLVNDSDGTLDILRKLVL